MGGVHFAQTFVTLTRGGVFGLGDEPGHGFAEIADLFFFGTLALATHDACAFAQQVFECVGRFGQRRVVGAVHKVLREHAALDVAMVAAADAQNRLVGAGVKFAGHFGIRQLGLQGGG